MPYCPKCDMEFIDGITICSDCKGPLVASKQFALELQKEESIKARETLIQNYRKNHPELPSNFVFPDDVPLHDEMDVARLVSVLASSEIDTIQKELQKQMPQQKPARAAHTTAYVKQADKYDDLKSSASAFFGVGAILLILVVLFQLRILPFPMIGSSHYLFIGTLTTMGVGAILVAFITQKSAKKVQGSITSEEENTKEIIDWFLQNHSAIEIDQRILLENGLLSEEETVLKRFELIQDYLTTGKDIPDSSYVDELCEEIYSKLFENA